MEYSPVAYSSNTFRTSGARYSSSPDSLGHAPAPNGDGLPAIIPAARPGPLSTKARPLVRRSDCPVVAVTPSSGCGQELKFAIADAQPTP